MEAKDRVEELRQQIREQRENVAERIETLAGKARCEVGVLRTKIEEKIEQVKDKLDIRTTLRETIASKPLAVLGGGLALGVVLGMSMPDFVRGIARLTLGFGKLAVRIGGPIAVLALAKRQRDRYLDELALDHQIDAAVVPVSETCVAVVELVPLEEEEPPLM